MAIATINRFIQIFIDTFEALRTEVSMSDIERMAMLVHSAMDNKKRFYHTSMHVFDLCEGMKPRSLSENRNEKLFNPNTISSNFHAEP